MDNNEHELEQDRSEAAAEQRVAYVRLARQLRWRTITLALALALMTVGLGWMRYKQALLAEAEARAARIKAEQEANLAVAQVWHMQAVGLFEAKPLLALRLLLEGRMLASSGEQESSNQKAVDALAKSIRRLAGAGRLTPLPREEAQVLPVGEDSSIFILNRANLPGELHRLRDNALIETLPGPVNMISSGGRSNRTFIVNYSNHSAGEIRRVADGSLVATLPGSAFNVQFSPDEGRTYAVVSYNEQYNIPGELRRTSDGALITLLPGSVSLPNFSPDNPTTRFIVHDFEHNLAELRRTNDGTLVATLSGPLSTVQFSPDKAATYFVAYYSDDASPELRRTADGLLIFSFPRGASPLAFSAGQAASYFVLSYDNGAPAELRRTVDGSVVATLPVSSSFLTFLPAAKTRYFLVGYSGNLPSEVRRTADGSIFVTLPDAVTTVRFSPDGFITYAIIEYYDHPTELYRIHSGQLEPLSGPVHLVTFSPAGTYFVVDYKDETPGELYRTADGARLAILSGPDFEVRFSSDGAESYFTVGYRGLQPEVRRSIDGALLATVPGPVSKMNFIYSEDDYFIVTYNDGHSFLWQTESQLQSGGGPGRVDDAGEIGGQAEPAQPSSRRLVELGPEWSWYYFGRATDRLISFEHDGQAYLLDLAWLRAMGGQADTMPIEELVRIACEGPFASGLFDEAELRPYLGEREPQVCKK